MAHKTGALATRDLERVAAVSTVQPKNVAFPTEARPMHKAIVLLGREAKQFKRDNRELKFLRTCLGRLVRDIRRKIDGDDTLK